MGAIAKGARGSRGREQQVQRTQVAGGPRVQEQTLRQGAEGMWFIGEVIPRLTGWKAKRRKESQSV